MAKKRILPNRNPPKAANEDLAKLEVVMERMAEIKAEEKAVLAEIRNSFCEAVVVFVDMVGSTKFKVDHANEPERWVLRVQQFSEVIAEYTENLGGKVVKYIGDEVMAVFDSASCVNDACNLVARIDEIETNLKEITGVETRIKVAIDKGNVCFLKFAEHDPIDPQGTAIDRCARIAKHTVPGAVLASSEFVKDCPPTYAWKEAGSADFKGLGATVIYQMGDQVTVDLTPKVELPDAEVRHLRERAASAETEKQRLEIENRQLTEMNQGLQQQIRDLGDEPAEEHSVTFEEDSSAESAWAEIQEDIAELKRLLERSPTSKSEHARFLFLHRSGMGDDYNSFEGRTFDRSIESKLVEKHGDGGRYYLDDDHPLNHKLCSVMSRLESKLEEFDGGDEDDLYRYSLDDPEFWANKIGIYVL